MKISDDFCMIFYLLLHTVQGANLVVFLNFDAMRKFLQVDGAYCGIIYRPVVVNDGDAGSHSQDAYDLGKLRLMRKDDLVVVTPNSRIPRCPENFQKHMQKIQLPSGISMKKMHSFTIDNTGLSIFIT